MENDIAIVISRYRDLSSKISERIYDEFKRKIESLDRRRDENVFQLVQARYINELEKQLHHEVEKMVEKYKTNLSALRGFRFDSGYEDEFTHIPPTTRTMSAKLAKAGIDHIFEEYNGDHRNRMWGRTGRLYTEVLPYFWLLLESSK